MAWRYPESPTDFRAYHFMRTWKPHIGNKIFQKYHRKHGGYMGIVQSIKAYDRPFKNFNYFSPAVQDAWGKAYLDTRQAFYLAGQKCSPCTFTRYEMKPTNSGAPYFTKRTYIKDQLYEDAARLSSFIRRATTMKFEDIRVPPVVPFCKSVTSIKSRTKTRAIWCLPAVITLIESKYGTPLYHLLLKNRQFYNLPLMHGVGALGAVRNFLASIQEGEGVMTDDWVKGDQQMPPWLIDMAFDILEEMIDFRQFNDKWITPEQQDENYREWRYVRWYFKNTPIVLGDHLYRKAGGIPSGSLFTLLVWSMCSSLKNCFLARFVENRQLVRTDFLVCGDDSIRRVKQPNMTVNKYKRVLMKCGLLIHNPPKSQLRYHPDHMNTITLSTSFAQKNAYLRDREDTLARCIYPSRWVSSREESAARVLFLAMSLFKTDPVLVDFADYYLKTAFLNLKKPIFSDRDLNKYFRYVLDVPWLVFPAVTTLGDVLKAYSSWEKWVLVLNRL